MAAPAAGSAALVAVVPREPGEPVRSQPVLARLVLERLRVPAEPRPLREPAALLLSQLPVPEDLVVEAAVPVERLLSRQSFSAAMAGTTL